LEEAGAVKLKLKLKFCAAAAIVGLTIGALSPALADPVYCSPSFQGYRVCSDPGGYTSNEWSRDGMQFGQDSDGRRWMIWRWQGVETTTVASPDQ
jgi:hypothetical protein